MNVSEPAPRSAPEPSLSRGALWGFRVIVTRPEKRAATLLEGLHRQSAEVILAAAIDTRPPEDPAPLQRAIAGLPDAYDWVVFTAVTGVEALAEALAPRSLTNALAGVRTAVIGPASADALRQHGVEPDLQPPQSVGESLADALIANGASGGSRILLPRAASANATLPEMLQQAGAQVRDVAAYQTVAAESDAATRQARQALTDGPRCLVTFTSPSSVHGFRQLVGDEAVAPLKAGADGNRPRVVSIGPVTSAALADLGWPVDAEAQPHHVSGLIEAVCRAASSHGESTGALPATGSAS
jgi:uroporphyrinogen III methyltransferase/synthase